MKTANHMRPGMEGATRDLYVVGLRKYNQKMKQEHIKYN